MSLERVEAGRADREPSLCHECKGSTFAKVDGEDAYRCVNCKKVVQAASSAMWRRYRFRCFNEDDPRPVKWPPLGPYWITGYGEDFAVLVAYLPVDTDQELEDFWPNDDPSGDAHAWWDGYDLQERDEITFTDRFPKPDWWPVERPKATCNMTNC